MHMYMHAQVEGAKEVPIIRYNTITIRCSDVHVHVYNNEYAQWGCDVVITMHSIPWCATSSPSYPSLVYMYASAPTTTHTTKV